MLFADLAPERAGGLVLVAPALPGPLSAAQALGWQTLGRLTVAAGPPVLRGLLRGSSNEKARKELGLEPRYPSWRDGFRAWVRG